MSNKVYCEECSNFRSYPYISCIIDDPEAKDYLSREGAKYRPRTQNQNNDCKHWEYKLKFIDRIIKKLNAFIT